MIKAVIVEPHRRYKSFTPYWRNDKILTKEFGIPVVSGKMDNYRDDKIGKILLTYMAYWSEYKEISNFIRQHPEAEIYQISNDYDVFRLNSTIRKTIKEMGKEIHMIASFPQIGIKRKDWISVNLNTLIYDPLIQRGSHERKYDIIYFGMFRKDRTKYFKEYFDMDMIVSTSTRNILFFKQLGIETRYMHPFYWGQHSALELFNFSLYLEDEYSHRVYTYPANRFYEALMFGVVQLFDVNCKKTFELANYDISDYIVSDRLSLKRKMKEIKREYDLHLKKQGNWKRKASAERIKTISQLKEILI